MDGSKGVHEGQPLVTVFASYNDCRAFRDHSTS